MRVLRIVFALRNSCHSESGDVQNMYTNFKLFVPEKHHIEWNFMTPPNCINNSYIVHR